MATLPSAGTFDIPDPGGSFTNVQFSTAMDSLLEFVRQMFGGNQVLTQSISGGAIIPTSAATEIDTESSAATDDLVRINYDNLPRGSIVILWPASASRVITVKHTESASYTGRIRLQNGTDHVMDGLGKCILLQRRGTLWSEIARVGGVQQTHGAQLFTSSGTFTIPTGVTQVWVTMLGGGGGGGGGAGTTTNGTNVAGSDGVSGSPTLFGSYLSSAGGVQGGHGFAFGLGGNAVGFGSNPGQNAFSTIGGGGGIGSPTPLGMAGIGGNGGAGADSSSYGGGGGGASGGCSAAMYVKELITGLTPGGTVAVTIGAGGAGGAGGVGNDATGTSGASGANGACLVEW